ncbi:OmpP1/FadL family transporter [Candidatus Margulisiibacteriota bacterium]
MKNKYILKLSFSLCLIAIFSTAAFAAGFEATIIGLRGTVLAGALTGVADDASAVYYNPAGLAMMKPGAMDYEVSVGVMPTGFEYTNAVNGVKSKSTELALFPSLFLSKAVNDSLACGLGIYVPYGGGGVKYNVNAALIEPGTTLEFASGFLAFSPAVSYKVMPDLSVGVALNIYYGYLSSNLTYAAGVMGANAVPIEQSYSGIAGYNAHIGVLYKLSEAMNIGLFARTPTSLEVDGKRKLPVDENSKAKMTVPSKVALGLSYQVSDALMTAFNVGYVLNEDLKEITFAHDSGDVVQTTGYKNILDIGSAVEYKLSDVLMFCVGLRFMSSGTKLGSIDYIGYDIPYASVTTGLAYLLSSTLEIDLTLGCYSAFEQENSGGKYGANHILVQTGVKGRF